MRFSDTDACALRYCEVYDVLITLKEVFIARTADIFVKYQKRFRFYAQR